MASFEEATAGIIGHPERIGGRGIAGFFGNRILILK
jgi:hypothetical protein